MCHYDKLTWRDTQIEKAIAILRWAVKVLNAEGGIAGNPG